MQNSVFICDFSQHYARVAYGYNALGYVSRNNAAASDHGAFAYGNSAVDYDVACKPYVIAYRDRFCVFEIIVAVGELLYRSFFGEQGMYGSSDSHVGTEHNVVPDIDGANVENNAIVISEKVFAERSIAAVIESYASFEVKKLFVTFQNAVKDGTSLFFFVFVRAVEVTACLSYFFSQCGKLGVGRVVEHTGSHLFSFRHKSPFACVGYINFNKKYILSQYSPHKIIYVRQRRNLIRIQMYSKRKRTGEIGVDKSVFW